MSSPSLRLALLTVVIHAQAASINARHVMDSVPNTQNSVACGDGAGVVEAVEGIIFGR